jgi:UDP-glucose 4-epimerase
LLTSINHARIELKWKPTYDINDMVESDFQFRKRFNLK